MTAEPAAPGPGDLIWLEFSPQSGHEQSGRRPALVLSPKSYNAKTGLMICCPLTTQIKGYPFEVVIGGDRPSAVLADQVKCLDWRSRRARHMGRIAPAELAAVRAKLRALIG